MNQLKKLTVLDLDRNQLTGSIRFGPPLLTELSLYTNQLTGSIPAELGQLTALTRLRLDDNHSAVPFPRSWNSLTNLQWLILHRNQLTGAFPAWVDADFSSLQLLYLGFTGLSGSIPTGWGTDLTALSQLHLAATNWTGRFRRRCWINRRRAP